MSLQDQYDDAMFEFSLGNYGGCIEKLEAILAEDPAHFDAQLSLGMAYCRQGDYDRAIAEGHKAEQLNPKDQLVHTNLSLFYVKAGNKAAAEHHGLQSRIASWKGNLAPPDQATNSDGDLPQAETAPPTVRVGGRKPPSEAAADPATPPPDSP